MKLSLLAVNLHSSFITQFTRVPTHYKGMELKAVNGCSASDSISCGKKEMPLSGWHEAVDNYASAVRCSASQKAEVISLRLEQIIGCPAGKRAP